MFTSVDDITLRAVDPEDIEAMVEYLRSDTLSGRRQLEGDHDRPMSKKELTAALEEMAGSKTGELFAVWVGDQIVGHTRTDWWWDVHTPWLDVVVAPEYQRRGIGTSVMGLMLRHVFDDGLARLVQIWIPDWNVAAIEFVEGLGWTQIGTARRTGVRHGHYVDSMVYGFSRADWEAAEWR